MYTALLWNAVGGGIAIFTVGGTASTVDIMPSRGVRFIGQTRLSSTVSVNRA